MAAREAFFDHRGRKGHRVSVRNAEKTGLLAKGLVEHVHSCGMRQMRSATTLPRSATHASASASLAGDSCRPRMPQSGLRRGAAKKASGGQNANDSGFSAGSAESARDLNCCPTRRLLAGGYIPRVVYGRSLPPSAGRSAHGRCPLRVSRAAPPPASCRPGTTPPLRASPPRKDSAPQDRVGVSRELARVA